MLCNYCEWCGEPNGCNRPEGTCERFDNAWDAYEYIDQLEHHIGELTEKVNHPMINGETSDGYHTFNELYHHRDVLFSVVAKAFPERTWKSRKHHDGTMYDGMFIVGIETPNGQASYHYDIEPYWKMFDCRELDRAHEWDGHTPAQAIERIGKLEPAHAKWISVDERLPENWRMQDTDMTMINYLVYSPSYGVDIGNYVKPANAWIIMGLPANVTHWMPLPEPPREAETCL